MGGGGAPEWIGESPRVRKNFQIINMANKYEMLRKVKTIYSEILKY